MYDDLVHKTCNLMNYILLLERKLYYILKENGHEWGDLYSLCNSEKYREFWELAKVKVNRII